MSAPHFFVDPKEWPEISVGQELSLSEADSHHATRALRIRPGESVTVANALGLWGEGILEGVEVGRAKVRITTVGRIEVPSPSLDVTIAPPSGDRLSWAVQKLAELGVEEIHVIQAERSVRRAANLSPSLMQRLQRIAREAAMQSRQPFLTSIGGFGPGEELQPTGGGPVLMLWEEASTRLEDVLPPAVRSLRILIGPEGGWSDGEVGRAKDAGALLASMGSPVLRTETAAVVGAALVLAHYGRLG